MRPVSSDFERRVESPASAGGDLSARAGARIEVRGVVQGVGFRPWVYRVARELRLGGSVFNQARGVTIEAFGRAGAVDQLVQRLRGQPPGNIRVREVAVTSIPPEPTKTFSIAPSTDGDQWALSLPPDLATCPYCLAEILDPEDRHFGYPFTSCTACGPRFTITTGIPYDRPTTTMAPFVMCDVCQREYDDVGDRRFHAQTNACPDCGPQLTLVDLAGQPMATAGAALSKTVELLSDGAIVAIKGLGGFHLACDATREDTVAALRARKHRDEKPFAVMVTSPAAAQALAVLSHAEARLLESAERPIVLTRAQTGGRLAAGVAPGSQRVGLFLPYTPLHHLLLRAVGRPLVMTSANPADEPICRDDAEARHRLRGIADALLTHDREIATRCDDSVAAVIAGQPSLFRRSRGHVPHPIALARGVEHSVLGCGAHLKNTFCLASGDSAYLGPHVGDLDSIATLDFYELAISRLETLVHIHPEVVAHDLHPGYASTRYALARPAAAKVGVQHHHAHVVSAMAEHGLSGPVLGVAYDGTGWGTDGTAWGGELLFTRLDGFERLATFRPIRLAGGERAIRDVWRIALAVLLDAYADDAPIGELALFSAVAPQELRVVRQMLSRDLNAPQARGVGRLFDAVGSLLLSRPTASYEGQVAVLCDELAVGPRAVSYPFSLSNEMPRELDTRPIVRGVVADLLAGRSRELIATRFVDTLVSATVAMVRAALREVGRMPIVLTGGVFQNARLAEGVLAELSPEFDVLLHSEVPCGDGGVALGQVLVADAVLRGRS